jgi:hypothetical protein
MSVRSVIPARVLAPIVMGDERPGVLMGWPFGSISLEWSSVGLVIHVHNSRFTLEYEVYSLRFKLHGLLWKIQKR